MKKRKFDKQAAFYALCSITLFFVLWQFITTFTAAKNTMPGPWPVIKLLFESFTVPIGKYTIVGHLLISLSRVMVGFGVATLFGIIIGIAMGTSDWAQAVVKPIFELLRPIPPIAWIPLVILFFGLGETPKYIITGISAFANVTLNSYTAAQNVDLELIGAARMLGTRERGILFRVILPSCVPQIFAGMQVGLSTSWMAVLAAEMVGAREGCGWMILRASDTLNITLVLVGMIVVGSVGLVLATVMRKIEGRLCFWNRIEN